MAIDLDAMEMARKCGGQYNGALDLWTLFSNEVSELIRMARQTTPVEGQSVPTRECRHCGWLCAPNTDPRKKWYPLEQPQPSPSAVSGDEDDVFAIERGADLLEHYAEFIRAETPLDLERHPYLPEIDAVAQGLRAIARTQDKP